VFTGLESILTTWSQSHFLLLQLSLSIVVLLGVNVQYMEVAEEPTGTCAVLVTADGERSLIANLAAANHFKVIRWVDIAFSSSACFVLTFLSFCSCTFFMPTCLLSPFRKHALLSFESLFSRSSFSCLLACVHIVDPPGGCWSSSGDFRGQLVLHHGVLLDGVVRVHRPDRQALRGQQKDFVHELVRPFPRAILQRPS